MAAPAYVDSMTPRLQPTYAQVVAGSPGVVQSMSAHSTPVHLASMTPSAPSQPFHPTWRSPRPVCYYCGYRGHIARFCRKRQQDERRGFDAYERDDGAAGATFQRRPYVPPPRRSPSPSATSEMAPTYRPTRRRSPSPLRRSTSPLRPVSQFTDHRPEN